AAGPSSMGVRPGTWCEQARWCPKRGSDRAEPITSRHWGRPPDLSEYDVHKAAPEREPGRSAACEVTMTSLPPFLAARYRFATTHEIRSWSFGVVRSRRTPDTTDWREQRGTLDDRQIFGPLREFECACGKYRGQEYRGMICDRCGVKITSPAVR